MKKSKKIFSVAALSLAVTANSFIPGIAAQKNDFMPSVRVIDNMAHPSFVAGELTEKSSERPETIVEKYLNNRSGIKGYSTSVQGKSFKTDQIFQNSMGKTVVKTRQTYNGVPIYGSERNLHVNLEGVIDCIVGKEIEEDIGNKLKESLKSSKVSQNEVLKAIEKYLGISLKHIKTPQVELLLYPTQDQYRYVFEAKLCYEDRGQKTVNYYVDANTLLVIDEKEQVANAEQSVVGSGYGQVGTLKSNLWMVVDNGLYSLKNNYENVETRNYKTNIRFSEGDNLFNSGTETNFQKNAIDAHHNVSKVVQFFKGAPFRRNGEDDLGSFVNVYIDPDRTDVNAWGSTNWIKFAVGKNLRSTSCALDVAAHEFTHGVLFFETLNYSGEAGALHEGLSDVFATICESYMPSEGSPDWLMGEDTGTSFRDCANPYISNYTQYKPGITGPHDGGGIITKAASLLAMGGTHNNRTVDRMGNGYLANIYYHAINDGYIVPNLTIQQFALSTIKAATELYGAGSWEVKCVKDSFIAVKVCVGPGDVNGDNQINSTDASMIRGHVYGTQLLTGDQLVRADFNLDGSVNSTDLATVTRYIMN
jgi:bacillolysin